MDQYDTASVPDRFGRTPDDAAEVRPAAVDVVNHPG
jgi:hypothetical protein